MEGALVGMVGHMNNQLAPRSINGLAVDREPWSRQPREGEKAWLAFQGFLNQDPPRSIERLAQEHGKTSAHNYYQWSSKYRWPLRVNAYDGWLVRAHDQETLATIKEMNDRHANLAKAMSGKVAARLARLEPSELSPGELGRWMQVIAMVERLARGEVTERTGGDGVNVNIGVAVDATTQEVQLVDASYIGEVMDRLAARGIVPRPVLDVGPAVLDDPASDEVHPPGP